MKPPLNRKAPIVQCLLGALLTVTLAALPLVYYRWTDTHSKRLRTVAPGAYYRSGKMTAAGLDKVLGRYKICTVINLIDSEPDPQLRRSFFDGKRISEKSICRQHGVKHVFLRLDLANRRRNGPPQAVTELLSIFDDRENYPILVHCRAGLHRTGIVNALYRIEYDHWSPTRAWHELRDNGFGEDMCYADNVYIRQYIFNYRPRTGGEKT